MVPFVTWCRLNLIAMMCDPLEEARSRRGGALVTVCMTWIIFHFLDFASSFFNQYAVGAHRHRGAQQIGRLAPRSPVAARAARAQGAAACGARPCGHVGPRWRARSFGQRPVVDDDPFEGADLVGVLFSRCREVSRLSVSSFV